MAWPTRDADIIQWVRSLMSYAPADLPDTDSQALTLVSGRARAFFTENPGLATAWASDLDNTPVPLQPATAECLGAMTAAVLIRIPPAAGRQIITESRIGQLQEKYKVPGIDGLGDYFECLAREAASSIPGSAASEAGDNDDPSVYSPFGGNSAIYIGKPTEGAIDMLRSYPDTDLRISTWSEQEEEF